MVLQVYFIVISFFVDGVEHKIYVVMYTSWFVIKSFSELALLVFLLTSKIHACNEHLGLSSRKGDKGCLCVLLLTSKWRSCPFVIWLMKNWNPISRCFLIYSWSLRGLNLMQDMFYIDFLCLSIRPKTHIHLKIELVFLYHTSYLSMLLIFLSCSDPKIRPWSIDGWRHHVPDHLSSLAFETWTNHNSKV